MKSTDKFLIGIVAGIILLVVVALVVASNRPEPTFQADDTPAGVAHNYLLALQQKDYERAYRYLSPTPPGYPDSVEAFVRDVQDYQWQFGGEAETTLQIESTSITGQLAVVEVQASRFYRGTLFDSSQSTTQFKMQLQQEADGWKIITSDDYFASCWLDKDGCR